MDETKRKVVNTICLVLVVVLAVIFGLLAYSSRKEEMQERARLQQIADDVQPKEAELRDLQEKLGEMEKQISYASDTARIMVGFVLSQPDDIDYIQELSVEYGFSPVLVLNCALDAGTLADRIALAADTGWEIMLTASPFTGATGEEIDAAQVRLQDSGLQDSGVFLLRDDDYSVKHTEMLLKKSFVGYTRFHQDVPADGCTNNSIVYFDYSYIQTIGTAISGRLSALYNEKTSMILVFDMDAVKRGDLPKEEITNILDLTKEYTDRDDCMYISIEEVTAKLLETGEIEAKRRDEYAQYEAEQRQREEELQKGIERIYEGNP